jgi:hypothetical protein
VLGDPGGERTTERENIFIIEVTVSVEEVERVETAQYRLRFIYCPGM